jgi:hypothetical protein
MAISLMPTRIALARADSRTPITSRTMMTRTISIASRLNAPTGGAADSHNGISMPAPASSLCM